MLADGLEVYNIGHMQPLNLSQAVTVFILNNKSIIVQYSNA